MLEEVRVSCCSTSHIKSRLLLSTPNEFSWPTGNTSAVLLPRELQLVILTPLYPSATRWVGTWNPWIIFYVLVLQYHRFITCTCVMNDQNLRSNNYSVTKNHWFLLQTFDMRLKLKIFRDFCFVSKTLRRRCFSQWHFRDTIGIQFWS